MSYLGYLSRCPLYSDIHMLSTIDNELSWLVTREQLHGVDSPPHGKKLVEFSMIRFGPTGLLRPQRIHTVNTHANPDALKFLFSSDNPEDWQPVVREYLSSLSTEDAVGRVSQKLRACVIVSEVTSLLEAIPFEVYLEPNADYIRSRLTSERRWAILLQGHNNGETLQRLHILTLELSKDENKGFWKEHIGKLPINSPLLTLAPVVVLRELISTFNRRMIYGGEVSISMPEAYSRDVKLMKRYLRENDRKLASIWANEEGPKESYEKRAHQAARMLSARLAERVADFFYRDLKCNVVDISIQQLSGTGEWRTHDLLVNRVKPIDVKNARTGRNDCNNYVEHLVPRFKQNREGTDVTILGVLSPYVPLSGFELNSEFEPETQIRILGETSWRSISELERRFGTDSYFRLYISPDALKQERYRQKTYYVIPSWMFDYPEECYSVLYSILNRIGPVADTDVPPPEVFEAIGERMPIGWLTAARRAIPESWRQSLKPWQQDFIEKVQKNKGRLTLPVLFLTILNHFSLCFTTNIDGYDPVEYLELLFLERWPTPIKYRDNRKQIGVEIDETRTVTILYEDDSTEPELYQYRYPLGIVDPLGLIKKLVSNLAAVWKNRENIGLQQFKQFEYRGLGILKAREFDESHWTTILAYCGGRNADLTVCGKSSLYLGQPGVEKCQKCSRLICPECSFCSLTCEAYLNRLRETSAHQEKNEKLIAYVLEKKKRFQWIG